MKSPKPESVMVEQKKKINVSAINRGTIASTQTKRERIENQKRISGNEISHIFNTEPERIKVVRMPNKKMQASTGMQNALKSLTD